MTPAALAAQLRLLERRIASIEGSTDRFDDWESCLSFLPVTEDGDARQEFGFLVGTAAACRPSTSTAPRWDDPDYQLLGFVGSNRPFGNVECQTEPGEASDRPIPRRVRDRMPPRASWTTGPHGPAPVAEIAG